MVLLTFAIILVIALIISLISYVIKEFKKPKGERFDVKGQINQKINTLKNLNKQKVKNFLFGTNFRRGWLPSAVVYVFEDNEVRPGSLQEALSAETIATGDKVWMAMYRGTVKTIIIVK